MYTTTYNKPRSDLQFDVYFDLYKNIDTYLYIGAQQ